MSGSVLRKSLSCRGIMEAGVVLVVVGGVVKCGEVWRRFT